MYLYATKPDIIYAVSLISRFIKTAKETHWKSTKRILRYVNGKKEYGVLYSKIDDFKLTGHTDSDWVMIERAHYGMFFIWDMEPFDGLPRRNQ